MKSHSTSLNGIIRTITVGPITVDSVGASQFQKKGTLTAQLRQVITTLSSYPTTKVANSKQDSLSDASDFNFESQNFTSVENRVAFPFVAEGTTMEQAIALVAKNPDACLYKALSNKPLITEDQQYAIDNNIRTYAEFANGQVLRFPETPETIANGTAGKIVLDSNKQVQYRAVYFSRTEKADEDYRSTAPGYVSPEIEAELKSYSNNAILVQEQGLS